MSFRFIPINKMEKTEDENCYYEVYIENEHLFFRIKTETDNKFHTVLSITPGGKITFFGPDGYTHAITRALTGYYTQSLKR